MKCSNQMILLHFLISSVNKQVDRAELEVDNCSEDIFITKCLINMNHPPAATSRCIQLGSFAFTCVQRYFLCQVYSIGGLRARTGPSITLNQPAAYLPINSNK